VTRPATGSVTTGFGATVTCTVGVGVTTGSSVTATSGVGVALGTTDGSAVTLGVDGRSGATIALADPRPVRPPTTATSDPTNTALILMASNGTPHPATRRGDENSLLPLGAP